MTRACQPWEQQDGEPPAAFARFAIYRDLGPLRSLKTAFEAYCASAGRTADEVAKGEAAQGGKTQRASVSGQWTRDSSRWRWTERAAAWDVHSISTQGRKAIIKFVSIIERLASRALAGALQHEPKNWGQVLDTVELLSRLIPPDSLAALLNSREQTPPPAPAPVVEDLRSLMTPEELQHLEALETRARARQGRQAKRERWPAPKTVTPQAKEQPPQKQPEPEPDYLTCLKAKEQP